LRRSARSVLEGSLCPRSSEADARLNKAVLSCKINGRNIAELSSMEVGELIGVIKDIKAAVAKPMVDNLLNRLQNLVDIGLDYLTLNRETDTLSGGESQRVKLVKHLSSSLIDVMYIFDEPSVALHPRDVHRLKVEFAFMNTYIAGQSQPERWHSPDQPST
jgi:excinuclease UvrABC ATPase subunit